MRGLRLLLHGSTNETLRALPEAALLESQLRGMAECFESVGILSRCMGSVTSLVDRGGYLALFWLFEPVECESFASKGYSVLGTLDPHILPS